MSEKPKCPLREFTDSDCEEAYQHESPWKYFSSLMAERFEEWKAGLVEVSGVIGPNGWSAWSSMSARSYSDTHRTRILPTEKIKGGE